MNTDISRPAAPRPTKGIASFFGQWPLLAVVAGILTGLVVVVVGHWRLGAVVMGAALLVGAVERLLLPRRGTGLLLVRSRPFDVVSLALLGIGIIVLACSVPEGHG